MTKTVLITGASSGIGKATAEYFASKGWNVCATMRNPEKMRDWARTHAVHLYALDVDVQDSVEKCVKQVVAEMGVPGVLVNNAGFVVDGIFEAMTDTHIYRQFNTNVFGLMRVTRALLPHFRAQQGGVIVQISSMGGKLTIPLYSIYHGTKWAVEGFSESLQYELDPLNIRVKIVEPGAIKTDFYGRSKTAVEPTEGMPQYKPFFERVMGKINEAGEKGASPEEVAMTIYKAATDNSRRLRYAVGSPAPALIALRKLLPEGLFLRMVRSQF